MKITKLNTFIQSQSLHNTRYLRSVLGDYWWAKALLGVAFVSTDFVVAAKGVANLLDPDCETVTCTDNNADQKPAYTLKIITYGEANARLEDQSVEHARRVDVSLLGEPVEVPSAASQSADSSSKIWLTQDPLSIERRLDVTSASTANIKNGVLTAPVSISVFSNYSSFITRWDVKFYAASDAELVTPLGTVQGSKLGYDSVLEWNGVLDDGSQLKAGDELVYVLRVYDKDGHVDETFPQAIAVNGAERFLDTTEQPTLAELALESRKQRSALARQQIPIRGSRVRVYGRDLGDVESVWVNNAKVTLDAGNNFTAEYILPDGDHEFKVTVMEADGNGYTKNLNVSLNDKYMFLVGLADITVSSNSVSGGLDTLDLDDQSRYGGDIFVDGRLAFYLKGKVQGKYLVTARLDTNSQEIDQIFNGLSRKDPRSVFRRLDPEQYYPVYGDDSTLINDTDSQGKLYMRVDWDQSRALWGNFNSGVTGTELAQFNRSLHGAQLRHRSIERTEAGDHQTELNVFASEAQSVSRHNEFRGTGGSLYYLANQDIVTGSEKLAVEVRQRESGRVIKRIALVEGRDYRFDDIQGRIILNKPLRTVGDAVAPSIIKDTPLDGNELWLVADYEYVPAAFSADKATAGVRGKHWLSDKLAIGGTWVLENRQGSDHELRGVDATLMNGPGSWIKAEYAQSESAHTGASFTSDDGGLNFEPYNGNNAAPANGDAYSLEARVELTRKLSWIQKASAGAWVKKRDSGFSSGGYDTGVETSDAGVEFTAELNERSKLSARATHYRKSGVSQRDTQSIQADYQLNERVSLAAELRRIDESSALAAGDGQGTLAAVQAAYDVSDVLSVYGSVQGTVDKNGSYQSNDLLTIGIDGKLGPRLSFNAETSSGDAGNLLQGGADYRVSDKYSVYLNQSLSTDRTDRHRNTTTIGQRHTVNSKLKVFTEHQFTDEDQRAGLGHTFGFDFRPTEHTVANASYQVADFSDDSGGTTDRDAVTLGFGYKRDKTHASTRLEFRHDKSDSVDTEQWLTANSLNYSMSPSLRLQGKLNVSKTTDRLNNSDNARFTEAGLGFAYRPVRNDRLNMLGRLTHLYDLPPLSQQATTADEKALVGSLEFAYQVNRLWEAGGKIAHKDAQIRVDREDGDWIENDATLLASRLRYHLVFKWDALVQYHWLQSDASDDLSHGALLSLGKHVGENVKFAVGYNFTRFDDNLVDQDYDVNGWFVNLVGKY